jgi:hypothetical protein
VVERPLGLRLEYVNSAGSARAGTDSGIKPDGSVFNGNTRIKVLQERGFDVNGLPREILT